MDRIISFHFEENKKIQQYWDMMQDWYQNYIEMSTLQGTVTCAVQSKMLQQGDCVLEVACGPGKHSLMLASSFLKIKGVLISCDFSKAMVTRLAYNYENQENDFSLVPGNKYFIETEIDYTEIEDNSVNKLKNTCDIMKIIKDQGEFRKFVYGCQANNEILPFQDSIFNAYIANLSLMLVNNHINQLREAYRVLKIGSIAVFSVWGNPEQCLLFTLIDGILNQKYPSQNEQKSNFHLYQDKGSQLRLDLEEIGFKGVKIWEQPVNILFRTGYEFMEKMGNQRLKKQLIDINQYSQENYLELQKELIQLYDQETGQNTTDLKTFQVVFFLAVKE